MRSTALNRTAMWLWRWPSTKRSLGTSCCWLARATRIIRFCATARSSLTIAKRLARFCGAKAIPKSAPKNSWFGTKFAVFGNVFDQVVLRATISPLETQCGGQRFKWPKPWVSRFPRASIPWPGWPASRLILARFGLENCSSRYAVRVTMDTPLSLKHFLAELWPGWWRAKGYKNTPRICGENYSRWKTRSSRCTGWRHELARFGGVRNRGDESVRWRGPLAKQPRKKSLRRLWARGSAY